MRYYDTLSALIGRTPLLKLPTGRADWLLLGKLEMLNPGGSIKDRSALGLIQHFEQLGMLKRGMTIVESSSGNTAIALAMLAAERGYQLIAVVDNHAPAEKIAKIRALGGALHFCDTSHLPSGQVGVDVRRQIAHQLSQTYDDYLCLDQYDNPANPAFYAQTLGDELLYETDGHIDILIGSVGTGSSLCGTGRSLKAHNPATAIYAVEPVGSVSFGKPGQVYYQSGPGFPSGAELPCNIDYALIDRDFQVSDSAAFHTIRFVARTLGLFLGESAGAVVYQAMQVIRASPVQPGRVMVALLCDSGSSYLSHAYDDAWMEAHGLFDPTVEQELAAFYTNPNVVGVPPSGGAEGLP